MPTEYFSNYYLLIVRSLNNKNIDAKMKSQLVRYMIDIPDTPEYISLRQNFSNKVIHKILNFCRLNVRVKYIHNIEVIKSSLMIFYVKSHKTLF